jgi:tryptophan-rich sensory protein
MNTEGHLPTSSQIIGLLGWIVVVFAFAAIGASASTQAVEFYAQLARPTWAPPASVFGPVWTILYADMAISAWLIWRTHGFTAGRTALALFLVQLVLNALWSWLFFVWHEGDLAFAEVVVLWVLIVATIVAFWRLNRIPALLMLPYLAWVSFATALTYATWQLNPGLL